jgi:hypothetical protein
MNTTFPFLTAKGKYAYLYQVDNTGGKEDTDVLTRILSYETSKYGAAGGIGVDNDQSK